MELPEKGTPLSALLDEMRARKEQDADWRSGRTFSLVYPAGEDVDEAVTQAALLYLFENPLNPSKFPSVRQMEREVIGMTGSLLSAPDGSGGSMTSGGTESILLAVKTARDHARSVRGIDRPNMVVPRSAHPAFAKAAHFFGLEFVQAGLDDSLRADVDEVVSLIDDRTVFVAGSAPNYPFGVVDPIDQLAAAAHERDVWFHTDACLGGFLLPFLERLGEPIPAFDFRLEGVRSISADVHKYGYCFKGASVLLHRRREDLLAHQAFSFDAWPGGAYGTLATAGARPAGPIAGAWAVMRFLGLEGYLERQGTVMRTARAIRDGIESIDALALLGDPVASVMAFVATDKDTMAVGDQMDDRGWHLDRQAPPPALHLMVSPIHERVADTFVADLAEATARAGRSRGADTAYSRG